MPKLYYIANARMPNEKAHGIQIAKMCEAFLECGADLTLVVPRRSTHTESLKAFYGLTCEVPVIKMPTLDLYNLSRLGFVLSSLLFMLDVEVFLWYKRLRGERFVVYTVDMDNFSYTLLPFAGVTFTEMHTPKDFTRLQRFFFTRAAGVIATNGLTRQRFVDDYALPEARVIAEPNGVDIEKFTLSTSVQTARTTLSLPQDARIVLYVGRFYQWKGLDILSPACAQLPPGVLCYVVGGTREEFMRVTGVSTVPEHLLFMGERPVGEIPLWLRASNALLLLGTNKNEDSSRYTSPMKLFEYMASGTPIVASATPAITDVVSTQEVYLYEPDDALSLAHTIELALTAQDVGQRTEHARAKAQTLTWAKRAERILSFIRANTKK